MWQKLPPREKFVCPGFVFQKPHKTKRVKKLKMNCFKTIWSRCSALNFLWDQNCFRFCKERSDTFQGIIFKCIGLAQQIMIEKEAITDYMKILPKWERKLDQTASNSSPYKSWHDSSQENPQTCVSSVMSPEDCAPDENQACCRGWGWTRSLHKLDLEATTTCHTWMG